MARKTLLLVLCVSVGILLVGAGPAAALPAQLLGAGPLTDWISITSGSGTVHSGTVYLGPYSLQVSSTELAMMCFDAEATVSIGQTWLAYLTDDAKKAADLWFGASPYGEQKIHMISWLANQWDRINPAQMGAINEAIWEISADYAGPGTLNLGTGSFRTKDTSVYRTLAGSFLSLALDHKDSDYGQSLFLIPGDGINVNHSIQPFVTAVPVPESGTLLFLTSGLVGLAAFVSRHHPRRHPGPPLA